MGDKAVSKHYHSLIPNQYCFPTTLNQRNEGTSLGNLRCLVDYGNFEIEFSKYPQPSTCTGGEYDPCRFNTFQGCLDQSIVLVHVSSHASVDRETLEFFVDLRIICCDA